ncbi:hypothetical protein ACKI1I_28905 [Streptomyces turgidiscabies]|uniref:Uncharacterized protein n=1 Tax=Streptomyces turgidiscabies (strain Car8) TaxID=698760 RepID=L7EUV6_STRT8|nr:MULTISPECIES: hypothetical protein [Streptomyces]ELP62160.1 hypothetical protein STRTUCAR8_00192 [Streptomyces turgidiscabies Car8]MDX3498134.1 hypothetical protein [Streptomyces turgidiscabies]GAQ75103.1 hypothetical protein T45_06884 [Streptomyces turgidiscabies]
MALPASKDSAGVAARQAEVVGPWTLRQSTTETDTVNKRLSWSAAGLDRALDLRLTATPQAAGACGPWALPEPTLTAAAGSPTSSS